MLNRLEERQQNGHEDARLVPGWINCRMSLRRVRTDLGF